MIRLSNIHKKFFKDSDREVYALRGINLEIERGSFTILIGYNGSGKSTLLNVVAGNLLPDAGRIFINSHDVTDSLDHKRSSKVSRVFQDPLAGSASELTVLENFRLAALRSKRKNLTIGLNNEFRNKVIADITQLGLGLEHKVDQPIGTLSGGQRQALTLLMTVMDQTDVLLMDEPSSALDPATAKTVMGLAAQITRAHGLTTLLVTHNLKDAETYGDRIIMLENGSVKKDIQGDGKKALSSAEIFSWF